MATQTLRPNSTITADSWVRVGGTTKHGVLADDSDATYLDGQTSPGTTGKFGLTTYTLAAGERVKRARTRLRARNGDYGYYFYLIANGTTISQVAFTASSLTTATGPWTAEELSVASQQTVIDGLDFWIAAPLPLGASFDVFEAYVDLDVWERTDAPTVTSAPSGTITDTDVPTIESYTAALNDGSPSLYSRQVRVFRDAVYLAGGFDPETETDVEWEQTDTALASISISSGSPDQVQVGEPLANSDTYRAYVRYGKNDVAGETLWSEWDYVEFTLNLTLPTAPSLTVAVDRPGGRNHLNVETHALTHNGVTEVLVQRSEDGGATWQTIRGGDLTNPDYNNFYDVYDYDAPRGQAIQYRTRIVELVLPSETTIASDWTTASPVAHPNDGTVWVFTVPDFDTVLGDAPVVVDPQVEIHEAVGVFRPPGRKHAVVVTSGVVHGDDTRLQFVADDHDADDVRTAVTHPGALLVKWADGTQQYLRPISRQMTRGDLGDQIHRMWNVGTVEVDDGYTDG